MKNIQWFYAFVILFLTIGCANGNKQENKQAKAKVLVVHSYSAEDEWVSAVDEGLTRVFANEDVEVKRFYMNMKPNSSVSYQVTKGQEVLGVYNDFSPQVVIAVDDVSQQHFAKVLVNRNDVAIVFCGMENHQAYYGFMGENSTGVLERPNILKGIQLMKDLFPLAETVTVLTDDSPASVAFVDFLKKKELEIGFKLSKLVMTSSVDEWEQAVLEPESDFVMIYSYKTLKDFQFNSVDAQEVILWTTEICKVPTLGFHEESVRRGCLIGLVESGDEHGVIAARQCLRILEGDPTEEIPIVTAQKSRLMLNRKTAERFEISLTQSDLKPEKIY